jgi:hypothetical protein
MRTTLVTALSLLIAAIATAGGQSGVDAIRASMLLTPAGALPPLITTTMQGDVPHGAAVAFRYGYVAAPDEFSESNNVGLTGIVPIGSAATLSFTGGWFYPTCNRCDRGLMASFGGDRMINKLRVGSGRDASQLRFSLNGQIGYGQPRGATINSGSTISVTLGMPISLISGSPSREEIRFVPVFIPGFAFGGFSGDNSRTGAALTLGGGLAIYSRAHALALNLGLQTVMVSDAAIQFGVGLVFGGR